MSSEKTLDKALQTVAQRMEITEAQIAAIFSDASFSFGDLDEEQKDSQLDANNQRMAISLIQIYEALIRLTGNDQDARRWLHSTNQHFGMSPLQKMLQVQAVGEVLGYLDMHSEGNFS